MKKTLQKTFANNTLEIQLDEKVFYPHQKVSGTIILNLEASCTFLALCVYIFGKEKVWLSIGYGDDNHHKKAIHLFWEQKVFLIGAGDKKPPKTKLPAGRHEYRFECPFPEDSPLPPSLDLGAGKTGVYYGCWAHIEDESTWSANKGKNKKRKKSSKVKECFAEFFFFGRFFMIPPKITHVNFTASKKFALGLAPLEINVKIARNIFYVGTTIKALITVVNNTNKQVKRINTMILPQLYQKCQQREINSRMNQMGEVKQQDSSVAPNTTRELHLDIDIPQEVYPTFETGEIVRYSNSLLLRVFVPGQSFIEIAIPIILQVKGPNGKGEVDIDETKDDNFDFAIAGGNDEDDSGSSCCCIIQ